MNVPFMTRNNILWPLKVNYNMGHKTFMGLYLINGESWDQSVYETHYIY